MYTLTAIDDLIITDVKLIRFDLYCYNLLFIYGFVFHTASAELEYSTAHCLSSESKMTGHQTLRPALSLYGFFFMHNALHDMRLFSSGILVCCMSFLQTKGLYGDATTAAQHFTELSIARRM